MRLLHPSSSDCALLQRPLPPLAVNIAHCLREPVPAHGSQSALGMSGQYNTVRRKRRRAVDLPCLVTPVPYRIEKEQTKPIRGLDPRRKSRQFKLAASGWVKGPEARPFRWIDITEIAVDRARPRLTDF